MAHRARMTKKKHPWWVFGQQLSLQGGAGGLGNDPQRRGTEPPGAGWRASSAGKRMGITSASSSSFFWSRYPTPVQATNSAKKTRQFMRRPFL